MSPPRYRLLALSAACGIVAIWLPLDWLAGNNHPWDYYFAVAVAAGCGSLWTSWQHRNAS